MLRLIFDILVVAGFVAMFVSTWPPTTLPATRIAWGSWLAAAIIWAVGFPVPTTLGG